ncbi:MAG: hypothetical protein HFK02_05310 [Clostridia bacterium]|nr:hypothetical protein [Clostridia bacterium]
MAQNPVVTIQMKDGEIIKAELYPEVAPNTVNNFISLILKGYYNGLIFHRVINGFSDRPLEDQVMQTVTVDTFGVDYPEPEKL